MTNEQKRILENYREDQIAIMNYISCDFVNDYSLTSGCYVSDSITEYADNAISVYLKDQHNYFLENSEECEAALLEYYDSDSIASLIKNEGLYNLCCRAGACGAFMKNSNDLYDDIERIKICLIIDYLLNIDKFLDPEQIHEIAACDFDVLDDYADEVNETLNK